MERRVYRIDDPFGKIAGVSEMDYCRRDEAEFERNVACDLYGLDPSEFPVYGTSKEDGDD